MRPGGSEACPTQVTPIGPNPHCVVVDTANRFAYSAVFGADHVIRDPGICSGSVQMMGRLCRGGPIGRSIVDWGNVDAMRTTWPRVRPERGAYLDDRPLSPGHQILPQGFGRSLCAIRPSCDRDLDRTKVQYRSDIMPSSRDLNLRKPAAQRIERMSAPWRWPVVPSGKLPTNPPMAATHPQARIELVQTSVPARTTIRTNG